MITLRSEKGSALTYEEMDENFEYALKVLEDGNWKISVENDELIFEYGNNSIVAFTNTGVSFADSEVDTLNAIQVIANNANITDLRVSSILGSGGGNTASINGIVPILASQAEAEAGTSNTRLMTPLRNRQANRRREFSSIALTGTSVTVPTFENDFDEIDIFIDNVSLSGSDNLLLQIGTGGVLQTTGYDSLSSNFGANFSSTSGFGIVLGNASFSNEYLLRLTRTPNTNKWTLAGQGKYLGSATYVLLYGVVTLSGPLNIFSLSSSTTNTFDNGAIIYAGKRS